MSTVCTEFPNEIPASSILGLLEGLHVSNPANPSACWADFSIAMGLGGSDATESLMTYYEIEPDIVSESKNRLYLIIQADSVQEQIAEDYFSDEEFSLVGINLDNIGIEGWAYPLRTTDGLNIGFHDLSHSNSLNDYIETIADPALESISVGFNFMGFGFSLALQEGGIDWSASMSIAGIKIGLKSSIEDARMFMKQDTCDSFSDEHFSLKHIFPISFYDTTPHTSAIAYDEEVHLFVPDHSSSTPKVSLIQYNITVGFWTVWKAWHFVENPYPLGTQLEMDYYWLPHEVTLGFQFVVFCRPMINDLNEQYQFGYGFY
jgi:hypothetical protein